MMNQKILPHRKTTNLAQVVDVEGEVVGVEDDTTIATIIHLRQPLQQRRKQHHPLNTTIHHPSPKRMNGPS